MSYRIGSFNIKNLSLSSGHDLDRIANIINDNHLDLVAMQEVLSEGKALTGISLNEPSAAAKAYERSLLRRLKGNWEIAWLDPKSSAKSYPYLGEDKRGEGYAFLWNADKFELPCYSSGQKIRPTIWRQYRTNSDAGIIKLIREPGYGRFKIKNLRAEIRLITTHIVFGKPTNGNMSVNLDAGAIQMRRNEFNILASQIYPRIRDYCSDTSNNVAYTIILGDYNLNLESSGLGAALIPDVACFDDSGKEIIYTVQSNPSTLKQNEPGYSNNYDHFSYDQRVKDNIVKSVEVIDAVHQHTASGDSSEADYFNTYRQKVSDHIPIVIEVDLR